MIRVQALINQMEHMLCCRPAAASEVQPVTSLPLQPGSNIWRCACGRTIFDALRSELRKALATVQAAFDFLL